MALIPKQYFVYNVGDTVNIPFNIVNNSTQKISGVVLSFDEFPEGVAYLANYKDVGTFDPDELTWTVSSLLPGETQTIWIQFNTIDLADTQSIVGEINKGENADVPGESETQFGAEILKHPMGVSFDGYATKELLSIHTNLNSVIAAEAITGITHVIVNTNGNCGIELPLVSALDSGFIIGVKVYLDGGNDITISPNGMASIEGAPSELLFSGDYFKYVLCKECSVHGMWLKL